MSDLRAIIREVLSEEIAALRTEILGAAQEEQVRVASAVDLTEFAVSILRRASDPAFAAAVREGRIRFVPAGVPAASTTFASTARAASAPPPAQQATLVTTVPAAVPELIKPLITERDIAAIGEGQTRLRIGRQSRLTPLAGDEARRRGIRIERSAT